MYSEVTDTNEVEPLLAQFNQQPMEFSPTQLTANLGIASTTRLVLSGVYRNLVVAIYGYPSLDSCQSSQQTSTLADTSTETPDDVRTQPLPSNTLTQALATTSADLIPNGTGSELPSGMTSELNSRTTSNVPTPGPATPTTVSSEDVEDTEDVPIGSTETASVTVGAVLDNVRSLLPLTTCYYPTEAKVIPLVEVYTSPDIKRAMLYSERMPEAFDHCDDNASQLTATLQQLQSKDVAQLELLDLATILDSLAAHLSAGVPVLYDAPPNVSTTGCLSPPRLLHDTQLQLGAVLLRGIDLLANVNPQDLALPVRCLNLSLAVGGVLATTGLACCETILSADLLTKMVELIITNVLSESVRVRVLQALLRMCTVPSVVARLNCHLDSLDHQLAQASLAIPQYTMTLAALLRVVRSYQNLLTIPPALATIHATQLLTSTNLAGLADSMLLACAALFDPVFDLIEKPDDVERIFSDPEQQLKEWLFDSEGRTVS
jgi:hypothetical protein